MLVDTDQISLLNINIKNQELKDYATQMGITSFPYIVVYFNGERDHNIHGVANKETAVQILQEIERIQPKPVSIGGAKKEPVTVTPAQIPAESKEDHDNHGSPAAALEARVDPRTGAVTTPRPTPARPVPQPQPRPVAPQP